MKSIVVLVSGNGSNLQAILDQITNGKINGQVQAVIANKADAYGLQRAERAGVPAVLLKHTDFTNRDAYEQALQSEIDRFNPDLVVLAGFMRILGSDFVNHYAGRMLNIHPSLLPKFKGLNTHQRALEACESEHGASVHFVTAELDGGPVVIQSKVPVFDDDNADTLAERVQQQERQMYPMVIGWFCDNRLLMKEGHAWLDNKKIAAQGYAAD